MSTQEVIDEYNNIASKIFSRKNRRLDKTFKEKRLENAIKAVASPRNNGSNQMADPEHVFLKGQSFVVSLRKGGDDNTPSIFRSYECPGGEKTECEIWEAARATTAAPGVFKPAKIRVGTEKEHFIDGAVKWNNPSRQVLSEAEALFGAHRRLGCMVSLGTGIRPSALSRKEKGRLGTTYSLSEMKTMTLNYLTDPEPAHRALDALLKDDPDSYFRFSVPAEEGEEKIRIFEYDKMEPLKWATQRYLKQTDVSKTLDQLVEILCHKRPSNFTMGALCMSSQFPSVMIASHLHTRPCTIGRDSAERCESLAPRAQSIQLHLHGPRRRSKNARLCLHQPRTSEWFAARLPALGPPRRREDRDCSAVHRSFPRQVRSIPPSCLTHFDNPLSKPLTGLTGSFGSMLPMALQFFKASIPSLMISHIRLREVRLRFR